MSSVIEKFSDTYGLFGCCLICLSLKLSSCLRLGGQIE
jgi:hypothetical protein